MPTLTSRITAKGQTTVPRAVRERLRLRPGDSVAYVEEGGRIMLVKAGADAADDPFAAFGEWASEADAKGYAKL
jgi:antitoxin PrlF